MVAIDKLEDHIGNLLGELYLNRVEELLSRVNSNLTCQIPMVDQNTANLSFICDVKSLVSTSRSNQLSESAW